MSRALGKDRRYAVVSMGNIRLNVPFLRSKGDLPSRNVKACAFGNIRIASKDLGIAVAGRVTTTG